jgi:hypothetical protein
MAREGGRGERSGRGWVLVIGIVSSAYWFAVFGSIWWFGDLDASNMAVIVV